MKQFFRIFLVISITAFSSTVHADDLTESIIKKWIKAYPAVDAWMQDHEDIMDSVMDHSSLENGTIDEMMEAGFNALKTHPIYNDLNKVVKSLGYPSADAMMTDTFRIVKAFGAISMKKELSEGGDFDPQEMQNQLDQINEMPGISEEQKKMMKEQIQAAMGQLNNIMDSFNSVSEADISAITPFYDQISTLLEGDEDDY